MSRLFFGLTCLSVGAVVLMSGCERPLKSETPDSLHENLVRSVEREMQDLPAISGMQTTTQPPPAVEERLAERREQLDELAGPKSYAGAKPPLGLDLAGREQQQVSLSLQQAVATAVKNNLDLKLARLEPQIAEAQVVQAEAVFDAVFFANANLVWTDEPQATPILNGIPLGSSASVSDNRTFETGVRKRLASGGTATISTSLNRSRVKTPGFSFSPDPAYLATVGLGVEQPLLRNFGSNVNRAGIQLAQNADRRSVQQLKADLLRIVGETETAYWNLVTARQLLAIQQRLLERGVEVRDLLEKRQIRDANQAQIADAISTVEQRRAAVIRAQRQVRAASDRLKALINDAELTVGSETMLQPVDAFVESPIEYNLAESISSSLQNRPEVFSALLAVDDASIGVTLADNQRLPRLDLTARIEYFGLSDDFGGAYGNVSEDSFIDYLLGAVFEQPLGNRSAEAAFREARLQQSAAVIAYRRTVQQIVLDVKGALRDVVTNYELIQATRAFRLAQTENLRVLGIEIDNKLGYTPDSLNLLFQRQSTLAQAEAEEVQALANFNIAVAALYRAMGVGLKMNNIDFLVPVDRLE